MKFKIRQTKEEEQEKVLEFWLEEDCGNIQLCVSDDTGNHATLLGINREDRKLRRYRRVDPGLGFSLDEEGRINILV